MSDFGSGERAAPPANDPAARRVRPLRGLLPFLRPYGGLAALAAAALAVAATATLALPVGVRLMIDMGFSPGNVAHIDRYFLALLAIAVVLAGSTAARFYLVSRLGERVVADIRRRVYAHLLDLSPVFFEETRTGEVLSRLTTDTTLLQSLIGSSASVALRNCVMLVGGLAMLAVTSPRLTSVLLVLVPVVLLPILVFGRRVRSLSRASQDRIADTSATAAETLNAVEVVQAYTRESNEAARYASAVEIAFSTALRRIATRALLTAIVIALVFGAIVLVLWLGAHAVIAGRMSPGELGQFVLYAVLVSGATAVLSEVWGDVQRAAGAMERISELLHTEPAIRAPARPTAPPANGSIEFDAVTFAYPARLERPALHEFSLDVCSGESVGLVGPSGAGKSTVLKLLLRFYDPQAGGISLGGVPIAQMDPKALRTMIAIVPQQTVIFSGDALENIRYGRPDASDEEVRAAAQAAQATEFIEALPGGWHSPLGERGVRLSGGQQQRVAIARAMLRDAPFLLLDEATSALDAQNESLVQIALGHLMRGRSTIVIAHRLATVLRCDRLVVMDGGRIVDSGRHDDLVSRNGLYARLAALQFDEARLRDPRLDEGQPRRADDDQAALPEPSSGISPSRASR